MFFFFNDTATTEIYTLSLHDALPISSTTIPEIDSACFAASAWGTRMWSSALSLGPVHVAAARLTPASLTAAATLDRKSTRLNSSHANISYAVFCLKKKKKAAKTNDHK